MSEMSWLTGKETSLQRFNSFSYQGSEKEANVSFRWPPSGPHLTNIGCESARHVFTQIIITAVNLSILWNLTTAMNINCNHAGFYGGFWWLPSRAQIPVNVTQPLRPSLVYIRPADSRAIFDGLLKLEMSSVLVYLFFRINRYPDDKCHTKPPSLSTG